MPMITITDDEKTTYCFDTKERFYFKKSYYKEDEILIAGICWESERCFNLTFKTDENAQKVWDRLCEITGAMDIFDLEVEEDEIEKTGWLPEIKNRIPMAEPREKTPAPKPRKDRHGIVEW